MSWGYVSDTVTMVRLTIFSEMPKVGCCNPETWQADVYTWHHYRVYC